MPFTPLHMGPGMAVKALAGKHFSLVAFGAAQVAIDIEPLLHIVRGDAVLHGPTHTYLGAAIVAAVVAPLVRAGYPTLARCWAEHAGAAGFARFCMPARTAWPPLLAGALVGSESHVLIDSIMHADLRPYWPFGDASPLYLWIDIDTLHLGCIAAGVAGLVLLRLRQRLRVGRNVDD